MNILDKFTNARILVVGDIMLDRYWWGDVKRISPEAPVPVVELKKSTYAAGGAANVAANVAGLGASVTLIGATGDDAEAATLNDIIDALGVETAHLICDNHRPTTVKTRVIAHGQQVVRVDHESTAELSPEAESAVWEKISSVLHDTDLVIVSDYAKGLLTQTLLSRLISTAKANGKIVIVDPKGKDYARYRGAALLTPNRREAAEACNLDLDMPDLVSICGEKLQNNLDLEMVLITQSEDGMTLFQKGKPPVQLAAAAVEIYDVTGAGDTVIACLGVAFASGLDFHDAAKIANLAAGLVVEQVGTTAITRKMLDPAIDTISISNET